MATAEYLNIDRYLKHKRRWCAWKVEDFEDVIVKIILGEVARNDDGLGWTLLAYQQHGLALLCYRVDEKVGSHVVHIRNENTQIFRNRFFWIPVFWNLYKINA